jgi:hypothetical protein
MLAAGMYPNSPEFRVNKRSSNFEFGYVPEENVTSQEHAAEGIRRGSPAKLDTAIHLEPPLDENAPFAYR